MALSDSESGSCKFESDTSVSDLGSEFPEPEEIINEWFTRRPRTEYPQSEKRRETTAPSPPKPRPRPKPKKKTAQSAPLPPSPPPPPPTPPPKTNFERIMAMSLTNIMKEIVGKHPNLGLDWTSFTQKFPDLRRQ